MDRRELGRKADTSMGPEGTVPTGGAPTDPAATPAWDAGTEREATAADEGGAAGMGPQNELTGADLPEGIPGNVREYPEPTEDDAPSRD